jgi:hypothetical protein
MVGGSINTMLDGEVFILRQSQVRVVAPWHHFFPRSTRGPQLQEGGAGNPNA